MTNDEFILGIIEMNAQRGFLLDREGFTLHYNSTSIIFRKNTLGLGFIRPENKHYFIFISGKSQNYISEETYQIAKKYFHNVNYENIKAILAKELRRKKITQINEK